jgi:hypothetical protein
MQKRLRASEVAQTLRSTYIDAAEQEDATGGAELGRQREAAWRRAIRVSEHTKFEEDRRVVQRDRSVLCRTTSCWPRIWAPK